jgi:hypothetical protein
MTTISAPGSRDEGFSRSDIDLGLLAKANPKVTPLGKIEIDVRRAGVGPAEVDNVKPDTVVDVILDGELEWITTVERLQRDFPTRTDRAVAALDGDDRLRLPTHLGQARLRGGLSDLKVSATALFDLDIDDLVKKLLGDPAAKAGEVAGDRIGPKLAKWFDEQQVPTPGLRRLEPMDQGVRLSEQQD